MDQPKRTLREKWAVRVCFEPVTENVKWIIVIRFVYYLSISTMGITVLVPASQSHANAKHIANSNLSNISFPSTHTSFCLYILMPAHYSQTRNGSPSSISSLWRMGSAPKRHSRWTSACARHRCWRQSTAAPTVFPRYLPWHGGTVGGGAGHRRWRQVFVVHWWEGGMSTTCCRSRRWLWTSSWLWVLCCVDCRWLLGSAMLCVVVD